MQIAIRNDVAQVLDIMSGCGSDVDFDGLSDDPLAAFSDDGERLSD